jgi:hypothetical protein
MKEKQKKMTHVLCGFSYFSLHATAGSILCFKRPFLGLLGLAVELYYASETRCLWNKLSRQAVCSNWHVAIISPYSNVTLMVPHLYKSSNNTACFKVKNGTSYLT